jgi:Asp-tRNA(Asn)/Glu-tRNA(Gln) amidotransferase A subunit family amidase
MDDLTQRIVEAGARALDRVAMRDPSNDPEMMRRRKQAKELARACLSAAHALAEQEGVIFTRVPEEKPKAIASLSARFADGRELGWIEGRAATLAGKVTL